MKTFLTFSLSLFLIFTSCSLSAQDNALDFDDVNDYITVPNASSLISATTAMSVSCWVYPTNPAASFPNFDGFLGFRNNSNADFYMLQLNSTTVECRFRNSGGTNYDVAQTGLVLNSWQHFVMTYDGAMLRVYLNGIIGGSIAASGNITSLTQAFQMGKLDFGATGFLLNGQLDEVGLWSKALSAAEVACMYERGINPLDANLELYYDFNLGIAGGNNVGITTIPDRVGNIDGQIIGVDLVGTSSNFVSGVASHTVLTESICAGGTYSFDGLALDSSGVYYDVIPVAGSCDSIVSLYLTVEDSIISSDTRNECSPFTWIDGNVYTSSNSNASYTLLAGAANGCDSTVNLDLTIINGGTGVDIQTACDSFVWINGITYTASNNSATDTIFGGASNSCDSIIILDLTIFNTAMSTDAVSVCETYTWIDGMTYTSSNNTATFTIVAGAANGCDSIVSLDLTILEPGMGTDMISACDSYTWINGNTYTTDNNTATFTFPSGAANACDSIVTLDLTINTVDASVTQNVNTLSSTASGVSFQWLDCDNNFSLISGETNASFTPTSTGNYALEVSGNGCTDTSTCFQVVVSGIINNTFETEVRVFPNPTQGKLSVDLGQSYQGVSLEVYSLDGRLVNEGLFDDVQMVPVSLENQDGGIYFIHLFDKENRGIQVRVMKE